MEELQPNEEINGRYVLTELKGRGTFGQVWRAHDLAEDEEVAIKFYVALDHKGRQEFIQEYRIAAKLCNPNLLVTKDYGVWRDQPYLTMRYCEHGSAGDLVGRLQPGWNDEHTIWRFVRAVAAGLSYLHHVEPDPIVHQDIKPDNVLIDANDEFLISDFGISKRIRNTLQKQSTRALKAGAPAYMGPERFKNETDPMLASDVWSLGVSIYELAEGILPFNGMGGAILNQGAEIPHLSVGWSDNLNMIMQWCLEKETWDRAKASQVSDIAERVLKAKGKVDIAPVISEMRRTKHPPITKNVNRRRLFLWAMVVLAVVIVGGGVWYSLVNEKMKEEENIFSNENAIIAELPKKENSKEDQNSKDIKATEQDALSPKPSTAVRNEVSKLDDRVIGDTEKASSTGTVKIGGYAIWNGGVKNSMPDGQGTMTFLKSHLIDTWDKSGRTAEAGDRIEGTYSKGHLEFGRWYKSNGTTETIMLGER